MNLQQQDENISCNHIQFLDKKYNLYNDYMFKNNLKCNLSQNSSKSISENSELLTYLKSDYIDKKHCFFKPPENTDFNIIQNINYNDKFPIFFNLNTRIKSVSNNF